MHWNVALRLLMSCSASLAAMPMSSTYWAHWSALMTLSRYSRIKLEKADRALLSPCANLLYAKVLLAKLKASISIERWVEHLQAVVSLRAVQFTK